MPAISELAAERLGRMERGMLGGIPGRADGYLLSGEEAFEVAYGQYEGKNVLLVLTGHRLMICRGGLTMGVTDVPYAHITGMEPKLTSLTLTAAGLNKPLKIKSIPNVNLFADTMRHLMASGAAASTTEAVPARGAGHDPFDALRQLGELRDAGIITPDEFEKKKADIMGRI